MNKNFKVQAQGGFTLIELIVVIVILGILAATALPKFANMGGDARFASVNAAKGAMSSAASIVHGRILVTPTIVNATNNTMPLENINIALTNNYPAASEEGIMAAAGISKDDYKPYTDGSGDTRPTVGAGAIALVPASIADTATAKKCFITYTAAAAGGAPTVTVTGSAKDCE